MKALFKLIWGIYKKYEEGINYLIFGFLAFVLNYFLFYVFNDLIHTGYLAATAISWVLTVIFAYWTNHAFVFKSKNSGLSSLSKEFVSFVGARIATLLLEMFIMFLMVDLAGFNEYIAKLIAQVVVIVTNYILSKIWIFTDKK
ncbi:MAG: GtrA family protein [Lachnospiraceae bacterium]|nr:GtrA family protein [Lachnospiraceae bacterium]